jgi:hypothetical protein
MPVYPFLQSVFYRPGLSDNEFFLQGKYVNLILSIVLLAGLVLIMRRSFDPLRCLNLMLIVAFTVFIYKAGWFQSELLFYFLNFCLFLLLWRLLEQPSLPLAALTGVVAGLAHLTKASILPGLAVFLVVGGVHRLWVLWRNRRTVTTASSTRPAPAFFLVALLVILFFLATVYPYIRENKRIFGQYFYNVNSTFYIWYDTWEEAKDGTRAHGDRVGWPDMPADQIPSLSKYLREHSAAHIMDRLLQGVNRLWGNAVGSLGYLKYPLGYVGILVGAMLWQRKRTRALMTAHPLLCVFLLAYFVAYFLLYAWYSPIAGGNRLILAQFVPLMFTLTTGWQALLRSSKLNFGGQIDTLLVVDLIVLGVLAIDIYFVLTARVGTVYGGS